MAILRGEFAMVLVLAASPDVDLAALEGDLGQIRLPLGLEALTLTEIEEGSGSGTPSVPTHVVSVYGADHPGIVHAVAGALAERGVNISDLTTRLVDEPGGEPLYAMALEVALPAGVEAAQMDRVLADVADGQGVEVSFRALEHDPL